MRGYYPAKITQDEKENCYYVNFPDFTNIYTDGEDLADALYMGQDVLNLMLSDYEGEIPAPSDINAIERKEGEIITLIYYDTDEYKKFCEFQKRKPA